MHLLPVLNCLSLPRFPPLFSFFEKCHFLQDTSQRVRSWLAGLLYLQSNQGHRDSRSLCFPPRAERRNPHTMQWTEMNKIKKV